MRRVAMRRVPLLLLGALVAGCANTLDPVNREGAWRPTGVNNANLRAMLAYPSHLSMGVGATTSSGPRAADAVDRLNRDRVRPLPETRIAPVGPAGSSAAAGGGGGGGR